MSDDVIPNIKSSEPAEEKELQHKIDEDENPKVHGSEIHNHPASAIEADAGP